jgi:CheY-like chemotaxis protein
MARLLIVDDEDAVRRMIARCADGLGHEIVEAENSQAALALMATAPADVVFSDVQMPGKDGLWLTNQIRTLYPTTAVILATGVSTVAPSMSLQNGVLAYLVKPFSRQALLDALSAALDWQAVAKTSGPPPVDAADQLKTWLDSLEDR